MTKKIIVTGGAGFIGSHVVSFLLDKGHRVVVIDDLSSGTYDNIKQHQDDVEFHKLDLSNSDNELNDIFRNVDWVLHLAALADIIPSVDHPVKYHRANVDSTVNVLEASRKSGVQKLIYIASSTCYGIPDKFPTSETALIKPEYPYALTKHIGEQYVLHWNKLYHLPVISLRLFNVYGPRARSGSTYGAVFGIFLAQKFHNEPFTVVGDGTQTRDFTFISDIVEGIYKAADSNISGEVINLGSGNTYSVNNLVELLGGDIVYVPKRPGEPDCTFADITKAEKLLNYQPKVSLREGVEVMLENIGYWEHAPLWTSESIREITSDWFRCLSQEESK